MPLVENSESESRCSFRLRRIGAAATLPGISDTFKINKDIVVVGRNPSSSDIFLDSSKNKALISRLHARIITEKSESDNHAKFKISDTSLNGTYVNDVKIADSCDLNPGDTVTFGHLQGAILDSGMLACQPNSEFRFRFESYPATPPNKKQKKSPDKHTPDCLTKDNTPSPQCQQKDGPKTPLFPVAHFPDLSSFLTPRTPAQSHLPSREHKLGFPGPGHVKQSWQNFISDGSGSGSDSNDDLMAYAAAAGEAMEDSDEDIFSFQLPNDSPCSSDPSTSPLLPNQTESTGVSTKKQSSNFVVRNSPSKKDDGGPQNSVKASRKRFRKSRLTPRKSVKCSKTITEEAEDYMYNTCASVDCLHPHYQDKVVDWVQCDDCDVWYHVKCTGLTLKSVKQKSAKFHCGCI